MHEFLAACGFSQPLQLSVSGPGRSHDRVVLEQPFALVGRKQGSSLQLQDQHIGQRHLYLQAIGGRIFCVDVSSDRGILWGTERRRCGWLGSAPPVQVGPFSLGLASSECTPSIPMPAPDWDPITERVNDPRLIRPVTIEVAGTGSQRSRCRMSRVLLLVGTARRCRMQLLDVDVSRFHCSLVGTSNGVWVVDLLSRTGTRVNGQPIRCALIGDGDMAQVGHYCIRFHYEAPAQSLPAAPSGWTVQPGAHATCRGADAAISLIPPHPTMLPPPLDIHRVQQQMSDQFRQMFVEVARMVAAMHADQLALIQKELEEIRRTAYECNALQQERKGRPGDASGTDAVRDQKTGSGAKNGAGSSANGSAVAKLRPGKNGHGTDAAARTPRQTPSEAGASARQEPAINGDVDSWLTDRIATLQEDQQNRWQKLLNFLRGN